MKIKGLQKLTLLDYAGKVACTLFTGGCNFRCPFCHNASLVLRLGETPYMEESEFFEYLERRRGMLEGVCITGGEPMLHPDIKDLMAKIRDMGYAVKLDTNGSFPDRLAEVIDAGVVDYVAMDIKNSPEKYAMTVGVENFDLSPVRESIALLMQGKVDFEFRTTVVPTYHEKSDFVAIGKWIGGDEKYFLQKFKDSGDLIGNIQGEFSDEQMREFADAVRAYVPRVEVRG